MECASTESHRNVWTIYNLYHEVFVERGSIDETDEIYISHFQTTLLRNMKHKQSSSMKHTGFFPNLNLFSVRPVRILITHATLISIKPLRGSLIAQSGLYCWCHGSLLVTACCTYDISVELLKHHQIAIYHYN